MILFYGEGRLGNQIFQYQALSHITKPSERIFAVGLEDLHREFDLHGPPLTVLMRNGLCKRFMKYFINPLLLRPLARTLRIINYAAETTHGVPPHSGAGGSLMLRKGLIKWITFVDGGHYQNGSLWTSLFPATLFRLNPQLERAATAYLDSLCGTSCRPAFVHVRRGDYATFQTYGLRDLSLPVAFYNSAISELERRIGKTHLVFVTDDPRWVEENFRSVTEKTVVSFDAAMDFAIMTKCRAGILSNSTFALAAAFMLEDPCVVIVPRFWFGFRIGAWYPPQIVPRHPKLIDIPVPA